MMLAKFAFITRDHSARVGPFVTRSMIPICSLCLMADPVLFVLNGLLVTEGFD